jgi:non-ribosomal peptide synthetase component F
VETFPEELGKGLVALGHREGVTPFMALLALFQVVLGKWSGQGDVSVGTPVAGRRRDEVEGLIGFFVNNLVMRTDLSGDPTVVELLGRVKEVSLGAYDHQDVPFEKLVEELSPSREGGHNPLFQVVFALHNTPQEAVSLLGLQVKPLALGVSTARFDLELHVQQWGEVLSAALVYRRDLFEGATVKRLLGHYRRLVKEAVSRPQSRLSELRWTGEEAERRGLVEWNATRREYPRGVGISEVFSEVAERHAGRVAVVYGPERMSYGELEEGSNRLGRYLRGVGVGLESRVGVLTRRGLELPLLLLGVLKAGGAYVPLEPSSGGRLRFMVKDSGWR